MEVTPEYEFDDYDPVADRAILKSIIHDYNNDEIQNCTESYFKDNFLMAFFEAKTQRQVDNVRYNWEALVAKNDRLPVRVVDDNDSNKVLFIVPPMMGTVRTSFTGSPESMASVFKQYAELNRRLFRQGQRFIRDKLDKTIYDCDINAHYREQWRQIYAHYGLGVTETMDEKENVTPAGNVIEVLPSQSDLDEEMSFD